MTSAARENVSCHFFLIIGRPEVQGVALASTLQLVHYSAVSAVAAMSQLRRMDAAREHFMEMKVLFPFPQRHPAPNQIAEGPITKSS
jgi:hypothetical protein